MTSISVLTDWFTPLTFQRPFVLESHNAYFVMVSPSASVALTRLEAAKTCPETVVTFETETVGAWFVAVAVKLFQELHMLPSLALTQSVSDGEPPGPNT
ncbi:hypothetical protein ABIF32_000463 [Bradyrhizobium elkanii]